MVKDLLQGAREVVDVHRKVEIGFAVLTDGYTLGIGFNVPIAFGPFMFKIHTLNQVKSIKKVGQHAYHWTITIQLMPILSSALWQ